MKFAKVVSFLLIGGTLFWSAWVVYELSARRSGKVGKATGEEQLVEPPHHEMKPEPGTRTQPVRITMEELHKLGGVPKGWQFTFPSGNPQAGRRIFVQMECYTCHDVAGERFPVAKRTVGNVGPALTGMGAHHSAEYLAESIINPNAVIVEGKGYTGPDGLSIMPDYSEILTLRQLFDLVAYLKGLTGEETPHHHGASHAHTEEAAKHEQ